MLTKGGVCGRRPSKSRVGKGYFEPNIIIILTLFLKKSRAGQPVVLNDNRTFINAN